MVRARPISGSKQIIDEFNRIREDVIRRSKDEVKLKEEVVAMREKMRKHLDRTSDKLYDIKQGPGGMIDVEFISQYLLLDNAPRFKDIKLWTDNVRILEECSKFGIIDETVTRQLIDAYIDIRKIYHELSLADLPRLVHIEDRPVKTFDVEKIWKDLFKDVISKEIGNKA